MARTAGDTWVPDPFTPYSARGWWSRNTVSVEETLAGVARPFVLPAQIPAAGIVGGAPPSPGQFDTWFSPQQWGSFDAVVSCHMGLSDVDTNADVHARLWVQTTGGGSVTNPVVSDTRFGSVASATMPVAHVAGGSGGLALATTWAVTVGPAPDPVTVTYRIVAARRS